MKKELFTISFLFIILTSSTQVVFNKDYSPFNTTSGIHNIFATDSNYYAFGLSMYNYPSSLLQFDIDSLGMANSKIFGANNYLYYAGLGENMIKHNDFFYQITDRHNFDDTILGNNAVLIKYNSQDTIYQKVLLNDSMTISNFDLTICNNYLYSTGLKAYGQDDADHYDITLIKSDTLGNFKWIKNYGSNCMDKGFKIIKTKDNNLLIATDRSCYYTSNNPYYTKDHQWWVAKLDTSGSIIWDRDYGNPDIRDASPGSLIQTYDNCYIISGCKGIEMSSSSEIYKGRILKIDAWGNILWDRLYGHKTSETGVGVLKEKSSKNLIIIHNEGWYSTANQTIFNPIIMELSPTGKIIWFRKYHFHNKPHVNMSLINSFDFTNDGGYIFGGYGRDLDSVPQQRSWVIKTDSLGFDGATDFSNDTTYRMEFVKDSCLQDTVIAFINVYGVTAPYTITYTSFETHDSLYYSPMFEPYIADSLIITPSQLSNNDSTINIVCEITDGLGRILTDTISVNVACLVNNKEISSKEKLRIFPNPTNDILHINTNDIESKFHVEIFNNKGQIKKRFFIKNKKTNIDVSDFTPGIYLVKLSNKNFSHVEKVVIK